MNSPNDLADLVERIHRVSRTAGSPARVGDDASAAEPADLIPPPGLPSLAPLPLSDPVPLAEVSSMVPRAREKLKAGAKAPGILRPMFRNQGSINGIMVETCNRLVEVSQQLRQENIGLRTRLDALTDYLVRQHGWMEQFVHGYGLDRQAIHAIQTVQASAVNPEKLQNRLAHLEARENEQAGALARLETQSEHAQRWMQGLQVFMDGHETREAELQERITGKFQEKDQQSTLSAEDRQGIDSRLNTMSTHIDGLQGQSDARASLVDGMGSRLDGISVRVDELAAKTDAGDQYAHELHGHLDKLGEHFQSNMDGFGGRVAEVEDKVNQSGQHLNALQARTDGHEIHLAGLQTHADGLHAHLGDLPGHNDRVDLLQRRLDEAVESCDRARADLAAATTHQRYLEESNRRLDERQINDASYLRAQLGFHQRLFSHWLAPTLGAPASGGGSRSGNDPLPLGGSAEGNPLDAGSTASEESGTLATTSTAAHGDDANAVARRKAAAAYTDHEMDALYLAFEDAMRGNRAEIKERLREYVPHLQNARVGSPSSPVLDLGCGRGEWLEILRENGFTASGVDLNAAMIEQCRARRLNATLVNAIDHLATLEDASIGAITAFNFIEHLPFTVLVQFFNECRRVLQPGGIAIFETPNPTNVLVGSCFFYHDYTHQRPLPPLSTRFLVEHVGFAKVEILPLHPWSEEGRVQGDGTNPALVARFNELFYGPQDYAIIGRVGGAGVIS